MPIPPLTCPHIDRVIEVLHAMTNLAKEPGTSEEILELYSKIAEAELEFIRASNDELRLASKHWYDEYKKRAKRTTRR